MNEEVLAALAKARWNESVTLDVKNQDGSSSSRVILVPQLDRENGGVKWGQVSGEAARTFHLQTKKWIFPMLNDQRRNDLYDRAIKEAALEAYAKYGPQLQKKPKEERKKCNKNITSYEVLDIGTGTGLLAMLTEKHLFENVQTNYEIKSLEMAGPMADLAKQIIQIQKQNRLKTKGSENIPYTVEVVEGHSCKIPPINQDFNEGAHLCTSELLESGLLAEGWLPAMRDAWNRHLQPNAVVLPQRGRVVAQLVQGCAKFCGPHSTIDLGNHNPLRLFTTAPQTSQGMGVLSDGSYDPITGEKHGIQVEIHANPYLDNGDGEPVLKRLCDPLVALEIDVTSPDALPTPDGTIPKPTKFVAIESGAAEGILFWWELDLYGKTLTYSTEPGSEFQDHWHQCLYVFPPSSEDISTSTIAVQKGKEYTLLSSHTDSRVHFSISVNENTQKKNKKLKPTIPQQVPPVASPYRCWQLNDSERLTKFRNGIRYALDSASSNVLDISDFSLCGMMASLLGAKRVTSVESSSSGLPLATARVAQIGNGLPRNKDKVFQILQCHAESLTREIVMDGETSNRANENGAVDLIVGEPYYEMLEGWSIETALNYFYTIRMLKRNKIVKPNSLCVPAKATILACGIECQDLARAYNKNLSSAVVSKRARGTQFHAHVCGFDHSPISDCWNYEIHGISLPLWEYDNVVPVTEIVQVGNLDYESDSIEEGIWVSPEEENSVLMAPFTKVNRTCHAIAFWVDYGIRTGNSTFTTVSTGFGADSLLSDRQTVRILAKGETSILGRSLAIPRHGLEL